MMEHKKGNVTLFVSAELSRHLIQHGKEAKGKVIDDKQVDRITQNITSYYLIYAQTHGIKHLVIIIYYINSYKHMLLHIRTHITTQYRKLVFKK